MQQRNRIHWKRLGREKKICITESRKNVQKMIGKAEHSLKVLKERQKNHTNIGARI